MDSNDGDPCVSIGMPIYNEEQYLEGALAALLGQTYHNFELIISDNASTDRTQQICQEHATADRRIRYVRNEKNIGAIRNFAQVLQLGRGRYFMWASGHDLWSPGLIAAGVAELDRRATCVLVAPRMIRFGLNNRKGVMSPAIDRQMSNEDRDRRLTEFYRKFAEPFAIYGLIRTRALQSIKATTVAGGDYLSLIRLCLQGTFVQHADQYMWCREQRGFETNADRVKRYNRDFFPENASPARWFPMWGLFAEGIRIILSAEVSWPRKLASLALQGRWIAAHKRLFLRELLYAGKSYSVIPINDAVETQPSK